MVLEPPLLVVEPPLLVPEPPGVMSTTMTAPPFRSTALVKSASIVGPSLIGTASTTTEKLSTSLRFLPADWLLTRRTLLISVPAGNISA